MNGIATHSLVESGTADSQPLMPQRQVKGNHRRFQRFHFMVALEYSAGTMEKQIFTWLGREFVQLTGEGRQGASEGALKGH